MYTRTRKHTYANTHTHIYTHAHTHTYTHTHAHGHAHTHTHTHTHAHTLTHTHTDCRQKQFQKTGYVLACGQYIPNVKIKFKMPAGINFLEETDNNINHQPSYR